MKEYSRKSLLKIHPILILKQELGGRHPFNQSLKKINSNVIDPIMEKSTENEAYIFKQFTLTLFFLGLSLFIIILYFTFSFLTVVIDVVISLILFCFSKVDFFCLVLFYLKKCFFNNK